MTKSQLIENAFKSAIDARRNVDLLDCWTTAEKWHERVKLVDRSLDTTSTGDFNGALTNSVGFGKTIMLQDRKNKQRVTKTHAKVVTNKNGT